MSRYCYQGKVVDVWLDNDGGLWFYDDNGHACTVKEDKVEQFERQFEKVEEEAE